MREGSIVLAKMRSYAAWPAVMESFKKTVVSVRFFGDDTRGNVSYNDIGLFEENHILIRTNLQKKIVGYFKSVSSAEGVLKIPTEASIFNTL